MLEPAEHGMDVVIEVVPSGLRVTILSENVWLGKRKFSIANSSTEVNGMEYWPAADRVPVAANSPPGTCKGDTAVFFRGVG